MKKKIPAVTKREKRALAALRSFVRYIAADNDRLRALLRKLRKSSTTTNHG